MCRVVESVGYAHKSAVLFHRRAIANVPCRLLDMKSPTALKLVGRLLMGLGVAFMLIAAMGLFIVYVLPTLLNTMPPPDEGKILGWMFVAFCVSIGCLSLWAGRWICSKAMGRSCNGRTV